MQISNLTNLSSMTYSSNVYLVRGSRHAITDMNTLVDVGSDPNLVALMLRHSTGEHTKIVQQVILTHSHFDHAAILELVREEFRPVVYARSASVAPDFMLEDGQRIACGDREFEVMCTPGHSEDSICLYCHTNGVLFVGDTPVLVRSSDDDYDIRLAWALERLCRLDVRTIYFGHGSPLTDYVRAVLADSLKKVKAAQVVQ